MHKSRECLSGLREVVGEQRFAREHPRAGAWRLVTAGRSRTGYDPALIEQRLDKKMGNGYCSSIGLQG